MSISVEELMEELIHLPSEKEVLVIQDSGCLYFDIKTVYNEAGAVVIEISREDGQ